MISVDYSFLIAVKQNLEEANALLDCMHGGNRPLKQLIETGCMPDVYYSLLYLLDEKEYLRINVEISKYRASRPKNPFD